MITSSDKEYKATKRLVQGKGQIAAPYNELAAWIGEKWGVNVLNVIYDRRNKIHAPRIQVILEHHDEAQLFHDGFNFDQTKQQAIAAQFLEIINSQPDHKFDVDGLFVVFSAFAPIAREEADGKISDREIDALKQRIDNPDLWEISRCFGYVTFMFYTDAQAKEYGAKGKKTEYARMYFEVLKRYDEFDYLCEDDFTIAFDSKQNFDDNYESNWYYYYK